MNLLRLTPQGLYCPAGDFYVDPWQPVDRAVVTHAHSDHAVPGSRRYLACSAGRHILTQRLGSSARIDWLDYGQTRTWRGVTISLHPAGHVLGSAQVRLAYRGHVWVVTGDYKLQPDPTCAPFESVRCDVLVTESTFGLPIYRWPETREVIEQLHQWWRANQAEGKASVLYAYALGKAQRLLASLDPDVGPIYVHGAVHRVNAGYEADGVRLPQAAHASAAGTELDRERGLILAVPSAHGTPWLRRFGKLSTAMASGWMRMRGTRRRRGVDRGFVVSDHVDWPDLLTAIDASQAREVWVTHGYTDHVARYLESQGYATRTLRTRFRGESLDEDRESESQTEIADDEPTPTAIDTDQEVT